MGWVPTAMVIAGGLIQSGASLRKGYAAGEMYDFNAAVAEQESKFAKDTAALEEEQHRTDVRKFLGRQIVAGAAAGGTTVSGSDITPLIETAKAGEFDASIIRYGGSIESWRNLQQRNIYRSAAGESRTAAWLDTGSTLINTASQVDTKSLISPSTRKFKVSPLTKSQKLREKFGLR